MANVKNEQEQKRDDVEKCETDESSPLKPILEETKTEVVTPVQKLTIYEKLKNIRDNITVEPVMCCYVMPSVLASLATQNLNLEKACRVNLNFTSEICDALALRQTENYTKHEEDVQKLIASVQGWKNVVQTAIPVFLILFVGAWSDKTGRRKACILLPIVGEFFTCLGFIINTYYMYELPVEVAAMTEAIFPAITGGWFTNFIGVFSYIGDITTEENRTYRVGMVNLCMSLGYPIGSALSGILLKLIGYYGVFSLSATLYLFSLIYGYIYLEDPKRKINTNKRGGCIGFLIEFFDINLVKDTFKVAFKSGPGNRRLRVALLLVVVCVVFGPMHGEFTIMYLFTRYRFNWNEMEYSFWTTYCIFTNLAGTLFSISFFSKLLKLDDTILGIISNTSKIVAAFAYAFARTNLEIYLAPLLEILNGTSFIAMRSIATKLVSGDELGKINSLFGLAEATMPLVYGPLYTNVYIATLNILPGAVFLLGAALTLPSIGIFGSEYNAKKRAAASFLDDTDKEEVEEKPRWLYFEHKKDIKRKDLRDMEDKCKTEPGLVAYDPHIQTEKC